MCQQLCWIFELWNTECHLWILCMCLWLLRLVQCMGCLCSLRWLWWLLRLVVDSYFLGIVSLVGYLWSRIQLLKVQYFRCCGEWNSSLCCYLMVDDVGKLFVWFGLGRRCCLGLCWLVWNCFLGHRLLRHRHHLVSLVSISNILNLFFYPQIHSSYFFRFVFKTAFLIKFFIACCWR